MGQPHNNDKEVTPENTLQLFKDKLYLCKHYIESMVNNGNKKLILDKTLILVIKQEDCAVLNAMIELVPDLESYMHEKGFMDDNNYYVLPMGVDVEVSPS
ncbi:MAG TPA: hypothetical protein LFV91_00700 [Rickettsia endosymbiont of Bembidion nr. Transversale]|nr:hypothetical protein [Rickettsia endosymbiont of Stiretrus anchorago]HJD65609.1 hypothetical protein [Rickettsia endosymbiont of Bembidion nr. Transversale]